MVLIKKSLWVLPVVSLLIACQTGGRHSDLPNRAVGLADDVPTGAVATLQDDPLLGSTYAQSYADAFCEDKTDSALLPPDPRTLLRGDLIGSDDYAVHFNAAFDDCHPAALFENQARQNEMRLAAGEQPYGTAQAQPKTCGEWWAMAHEGQRLMEERAYIGAFITADNYNNIWQVWGLPERPEQSEFELMVQERYGLSPAPFHNPYPLTDEDPVASHGGSGRLPMGLIQTRDPDVDGNEGKGPYNGGIGITCLMCHGGRIGSNEGIQIGDGKAHTADVYDPATGSLLGLNNSNIDVQLLTWEMTLQNMRALAANGGGRDDFRLSTTPFPHNVTRGTQNAVTDIEFFLSVRDFDTLDLNPNYFDSPLHSTHGDTDMPPWWLGSSKARVYWDGGHSSDSPRGNMNFTLADMFREGADGAYNKRREGELENIRIWLDQMQSPRFPGVIDLDLARQGAVLFHNKNLWADGDNAEIPRPKGNGSCAGCHGVYSKQFADDPYYLPDSSLRGIASYVVPKEIIGTDPARTDAMTPELRYGFSSSYMTTPDGQRDYHLPEEKNPLVEFLDDFFNLPPAHMLLDRDLPLALNPLQPLYDQVVELTPQQLPDPGSVFGRVQGVCSWEMETIGYLAPTLHGVWASAPYFHNGSVPTLEAVLSPDLRPRLWRRPDHSEPKVDGILGFEHRLAQGYDFDALGWKYDEIHCDEAGGVPYLQCDNGSSLPTVLELIKDTLTGNLIWWTHQFPLPTTDRIIEQRKTYNSNIYSKKSVGHEFTAILSQQERNAVLEYLKTL